MRHWQTIFGLIGTLMFLGACNKTADLAREKTELGQSVVEGPTTDAKSDRPTEAGEGLPGYLIDPTKLVIEAKDGTVTISGQAGAVRNAKGDNAVAVVTLLKLAKNGSKIDKAGWQADGTLIAASSSSANGTFSVSGSVTANDFVFVRVATTENTHIEYKADAVNSSVLWIDGTTAKTIDTTVTSQITTAQLVEQVKTTGQCRNCDLSGADLSNLDIPKCDLSFSNLKGANLVLTNLGDCSLINSNLSQVDFTQANLANANLSQSDITGAIFTGANVSGVIGQQIPAN